MCKAYDEISKVCTTINDRKKHVDAMLEVLRVQRCLTGDFKVSKVREERRGSGRVRENRRGGENDRKVPCWKCRVCSASDRRRRKAGEKLI